MLYCPNPNAPACDEAQRKQITLDHLAWARAQFDCGKAVLAGAIRNHPQFNGMGMFALGSPERVKALMAEARQSCLESTPTSSWSSSRGPARSSGCAMARHVNASAGGSLSPME